MTRWEWGYLVYGIWIFGIFLTLELLGLFGAAPWGTLTGTARHAEAHWRILDVVIFGFLIGLAVHIRFKASLGLAEAAAIGLSLLAHLALGAP